MSLSSSTISMRFFLEVLGLTLVVEALFSPIGGVFASIDWY
jgi:hypothetical protein